jgi:hypothetical protein
MKKGVEEGFKSWNAFSHAHFSHCMIGEPVFIRLSFERIAQQSS